MSQPIEFTNPERATDSSSSVVSESRFNDYRLSPLNTTTDQYKQKTSTDGLHPMELTDTAGKANGTDKYVMSPISPFSEQAHEAAHEAARDQIHVVGPRRDSLGTIIPDVQLSNDPIKPISQHDAREIERVVHNFDRKLSHSHSPSETIRIYQQMWNAKLPGGVHIKGGYELGQSK